ncbi:hypothetical protein [Leptospira idonii]|uniref:DUF2207 domain-containing protein n=1 Tax=Leptospira idonii TaxID=1193500 RepID=A0A4R9LX14_9LEPT|nr:hypothetical protein [Leptospira idonii]TGN17647.1 hypothetical protein EHS15_16615 [Leptospira idonii]
MNQIIPFFLILFPVFSISQLFAKSLDWPSISIRATLTNRGTLFVEEEQNIRFEGDWNGAYRKFKLGFNQDLIFHGMEFQNQNGVWEKMEEGSQEIKGQYQYYPDDLSVYWRARNIDEPLFDDKILKYKLKFEYGNLLEKTISGKYRLNHEFSFSDRKGNIEKISVLWNVEDKWRMESVWNEEATMEKTDLFPGDTFLLERELVWTGNDSPENYESTFFYFLKRTGIALFPFFFLALFQFVLYQIAKRKGLFSPGKEIQSLEEARNIWKDLSPVEFAYKTKNGVVESWFTPFVKLGWLEITNKDSETWIRRLVPLDRFPVHDQIILESLLLKTNDSVSGKQIKEFYRNKKKDFSLSSEVRSSVYLQFVQRGDEKKYISRFSFLGKYPVVLVIFILILIAVLYFLCSEFFSSNKISLTSFYLQIFFSCFLSVLGVALYSDDHSDYRLFQKNSLARQSIKFVVSTFAVWVSFVFLIYNSHLHFSGFLYYILWAICFGIVPVYLRSDFQNGKKISFAKEIYLVREYFRNLLRNEKKCSINSQTGLYLPALDLNDEVIQRQKEKKDCIHLFPVPDQSIEVVVPREKGRSVFFVSSSQSGNVSGFTAGGGSFGGGGASGSWESMSLLSTQSSYSVPSSSSSSGSGSSSSGGGGGGGW